MTGAHGLLGTDVRRTLSDHGIAHTSVGRDDVALTDPEAVARAVAGHDVVVNCAAWTAVDLAESHQEQATEINTRAAGVVARAAYEQGARIVQMSTNYVFDGEARTPYAEDAPLSPRTTYGRTKAAGERAVREAAPGRHLILRTGWLYGAHGSCFARTVTRIAREHGIVDVVDDQYGQPTWTRGRCGPHGAARRAGRAGRHLARDSGRPDHLVRLRPRGGRVGRPRDGRGQADPLVDVPT